MSYEVIVGNIGNVLHTKSWNIAVGVYNEYVSLSKDNYGRAAGESVILLKSGEPIKEYVGDTDWLTNLFEFENCEECGKDESNHEVNHILNNRFARCKL